MCVFVVCPDVIDSDPENKQATNNLSDPMLLIYNVCGATFFFPPTSNQCGDKNTFLLWISRNYVNTSEAVLIQQSPIAQGEKLIEKKHFWVL